jgi:hypothetical protein
MDGEGEGICTKLTKRSRLPLGELFYGYKQSFRNDGPTVWFLSNVEIKLGCCLCGRLKQQRVKLELNICQFWWCDEAVSAAEAVYSEEVKALSMIDSWVAKQR